MKRHELIRLIDEYCSGSIDQLGNYLRFYVKDDDEIRRVLDPIKFEVGNQLVTNFERVDRHTWCECGFVGCSGCETIDEEIHGVLLDISEIIAAEKLDEAVEQALA